MEKLWGQQHLITIPRWYGFHGNNVNAIELQVFADVSSLAYGATAYFRSASNNDLTIIFILAKSRLASLKERLLTIHKLELQTAVIVATMKETVLHEFSFQPRAIFLWTDSKTVFRYIQNEKGHFPIFAMHHIITSEISDWHYIPSEKKNPADLCTRTQTDFKLIQQKLFHGPENILLKTFDLKKINIRNQFEESLEINTSLITVKRKIVTVIK